MSRMVSRWESKCKVQGGKEIQGYMDSNGIIKYSFISLNRNQGDCTKEKDMLIKRFDMVCIFNNEEEAKEEFELLGFLL